MCAVVSADADGQSIEPSWTVASLRSHREERSYRDQPQHPNSSYV